MVDPLMVRWLRRDQGCSRIPFAPACSQSPSKGPRPIIKSSTFTPPSSVRACQGACVRVLYIVSKPGRSIFRFLIICADFYFYSSIQTSAVLHLSTEFVRPSKSLSKLLLK